MIIPTTYNAALLLLVLSLLCFGSWINTFRLAGPKWRFELYYIDFAVGVMLFAVTAAFTLGSMGSDLSFQDRLLVSSKTNEALVIAGGGIFNLGNMLLLAAVSSLGMSGAFPLSIGIAIIIGTFTHFRANNVVYLIAGLVLMIMSVFSSGIAVRIRDVAIRRAAAAKSAAVKSAGPAAEVPDRQPRTPLKAGVAAVAVKASKPPSAAGTGSIRFRRGIVVACLSGIALGLFYRLAVRGVTGDLGVGAYAGVLLFGGGLLASTILYNFYFLNIGIDGGRVGANAYFKGKGSQHLLGFLGGAIWAAGALAFALALQAPLAAEQNRVPQFVLPLASVLIVMFCGIAAWKENAAAPKNGSTLLMLTAAFFLAGLLLIGFGVAR